MKDQLARLRELQYIDLQLDEYKTKKKEIQDRLDENRGFLNKLVEDLETQKSELEEIKNLQSQKKSDLRDLQEQHKSRKKRLAQVGSTKEYNAVEKELDVLKKSVEQTEEELLHLAEVIDSTETSIAEKEEKIDQLRDSVAEEHSDAEDQLAALEDSVAALLAREEEARSECSKRVLYKYDFIRSRRPGLAVVAAKDAHCEGCYMAVPPQLYIEIQRGESLITCPSCQRILYFYEDAIDEEGVKEVKAAAAAAKG